MSRMPLDGYPHESNERSEASEEILKKNQRAKILPYNIFDDEYIVKALKCGVKGYLLKQDYASILPAIGQCARGRRCSELRSYPDCRNF